MTVTETSLPGVLLVAPRVFKDSRGEFFECYKHPSYVASGIDCEFVQDNVSLSGANVIRGLHYQVPNPQAKLIHVLSGSILDVAVDIRQGSQTFGQWVAVELSDVNRHQLFIPAGFAHGFAVLKDPAVVSYKCSTVYDPTGDSVVLWDDPDIGVEWPFDSPLLSPKDQAGLRLREVPANKLPSC